MTVQFSGFDWDAGNREKCLKHGVSIAEIEFLFMESRLRVRPDIEHSQSEQRFQAVGRTEAGRHVFLVFTLRGAPPPSLIRPISARYMHKPEVEAYEEAISRLQE